MKRYFSAFLLVLWAVTAPSAYAAVYEWMDDKGVTNLTDDLNKVPLRYRSKVKKQEVDTRGEVRAPATPQPAEQVSPPVASSGPGGGHNQAWWSSRFNSIRNEMKVISDSLPGKRERLAALRHKRVVYQRARDRKAYFDLSGEIERDEARLKGLQESLAALEAEADRFGVPKEWR